MKTITWQDIIRMLNSDVYLYELGRKWGNDFLTSEQRATMIRKYQNELLDLQTDLADYTNLPLPDSATLIGIFMARCVIAELVEQEPVANDEILLVSYNSEPDQFDAHWTVMIYDPIADEETIGVAELSYAEVFGMRVAIDDDADFLDGLAALFNELTKMGLYDWERNAMIYKQTATQQAVEVAMANFMEQSHQIALFLDEYVTTHPDDRQLPDEIALFWPLTTGIMVPLDESDPNSPLVSTMKQDPKLLAKFKLRFGQAFRKFKGK
ncbi:hypothetical protein ACLUWI_08790 [Limosilactobacillus mucosae]|uniref:hypothetical protein n=1 Tax=Limosilactobacillus mucosae TaxID=97478 RepID=UPI003995EFD4